MQIILNRLTGVAFAAALCLAGPAMSPAQGDSVLEPAQQISVISHLNANPSLAFSADGRSLYVVWDGVVSGNRRIFLREQLQGEWLPPVIVDSNPAGSNSMPSVAVDSNGIPHVTWISQSGNKRQPVYARRISRYPNRWHQQRVPFPEDSTLSGSADLVSISMDTNDQPWIVWQYGFGNVYSVACTRYHEASGKLVSEELTPGANSHNIFPEMFFLPEPTVYWYLAQADQFYLIGAQYNAESARWQVALPESFDNVPAQNFPDLFLTGRGPLGAIWYDGLADVNGEIRDRVFLGTGDAETKGRGEVIDQNPEGNSHSVAATIMDNQYLAAWVTEQYGYGTELNLGIGDSPETIQSVSIRHSENNLISSPRLAAAGNKAAVAWEETSGPGQVSSEIVVRVAFIEE